MREDRRYNAYRLAFFVSHKERGGAARSRAVGMTKFKAFVERGGNKRGFTEPRMPRDVQFFFNRKSLFYKIFPDYFRGVLEQPEHAATKVIDKTRQIADKIVINLLFIFFSSKRYFFTGFARINLV